MPCQPETAGRWESLAGTTPCEENQETGEDLWCKENARLTTFTNNQIPTLGPRFPLDRLREACNNFIALKHSEIGNLKSSTFKAYSSRLLAQPPRRPKSRNPGEPRRFRHPPAEPSPVGSPGFLDFGLRGGCTSSRLDRSLKV